MHFFDMEEDDLYKSMGDRTDGCYPISDEGIWHAGIHVYFTDADTPVKNPIEGKEWLLLVLMMKNHGIM